MSQIGIFFHNNPLNSPSNPYVNFNFADKYYTERYIMKMSTFGTSLALQKAGKNVSRGISFGNTF